MMNRDKIVINKTKFRNWRKALLYLLVITHSSCPFKFIMFVNDQEVASGSYDNSRDPFDSYRLKVDRNIPKHVYKHLFNFLKKYHYNSHDPIEYHKERYGK